MKSFIKNNHFPQHLVRLVDFVRREFSGLLGTCASKFILACHGCRIGANFRVYGRIITQISNWSSVTIGDNVVLISRRKSNLSGITHPTTLQTMQDGQIKIGDNVGMSGAVLSARTSIRVGAYTKIGVNVKIYDHDYHSLDYLHRKDGAMDKLNVRSREVVIGEDVFIGGHSIILKGTRVGDRSIIGAGSVVAGLNIPPDSRVAGNPARII